ncbi:FAD synthetase [Histoplasma capsulatum H143]|uniref:FAD synthase n=1 Tax=Ajellomyces capsulatus (strain H143) TaxID=544712 RepID=C6HMW3_AJECH|nr:FAD synthetase [Histoplasma capsulatum H143]
MSTRAAGDALLPNGLEPAQKKCTQENGHTHAQEQECQHLHEEHSQPPLSTVVENLHKQVTSFLSEPHDASSMLYRVQNQTRISLNVIQEALKRFSLNELSLSYNGGKDCLVMLILFLSSLHPLPTTESLSKDGKPTPPPTTIPAIYAQPHHPFRSVEEFVASSSHDYHLSLVRYTTDPPRSTLRTVFAFYLDHHPQIRAIFVGTRRTDPHGEKLTHFDHTDHGWPGFMRIHPVIDWHYAEIWAFIRHLGIEYCPLYDEGYTSLGGTNDTHPNPKLKIISNENSNDDPIQRPSSSSYTSNGGKVRYSPAYELMDDDEERLGRDW